MNAILAIRVQPDFVYKIKMHKSRINLFNLLQQKNQSIFLSSDLKITLMNPDHFIELQKADHDETH